MVDLTSIAEILERGEHEEIGTLVRGALEEGRLPKEILEEGLIAGMRVVGERFRRREIFLPHVLVAAKAMSAGVEILRPLLVGEDSVSRGRIVLGTVKGDLHDIGKNLVGIMLRGAGFEVIDLGRDVSADQFIDAALEADASVIGMSALLTTTMPAMREVVERVRERGLADRVRTIVGGAPLSEEYAREIGADGFAFDATSAVECVEDLVP